MSDNQEPRSQATPGLSESFKALLHTFVSSLYTRFEIATTEIEEERERLEEIFLIGVACVFCLCMGILLASLFVIVYFWDTPFRDYVAAGVTLLYLIAGAIFALILRGKIHGKPRLFATTLDELAKDRDSLRSRVP